MLQSLKTFIIAAANTIQVPWKEYIVFVSLSLSRNLGNNSSDGHIVQPIQP